MLSCGKCCRRNFTCNSQNVCYPSTKSSWSKPVSKVPKTPTLVERQLLLDPNRDPKRVRTAWTSWTGWFEKYRNLDTIVLYGLYRIEFSTLGDFGSKRPRVRIPILRPKMKTAHLGGLHFSFGQCRDSKDRPERSEGKKQSGGLFLRPWENPFLSERIPLGCGLKEIMYGVPI